MFVSYNTRSRLGRRKKRNVEPIRRLQLESLRIPRKKKAPRKKKSLKPALRNKNIRKSNLCKPKSVLRKPVLRNYETAKINGRMLRSGKIVCAPEPPPQPEPKTRTVKDPNFLGFDSVTDIALSRVKLYFFKAVVERLYKQSDSVETYSEEAVTLPSNDNSISNSGMEIESYGSETCADMPFHGGVITEIQSIKVETDPNGNLYTTGSRNITEESESFRAYTETCKNPSPPCLKVHHDEIYNEPSTGTTLNQFDVPGEEMSNLSAYRQFDTTESENVTEESESFSVYSETSQSPTPSFFKVYRDKVCNEPSTTGASSHQFYKPNEKTTSNLSFDHRLDTTESPNFTEQSESFSVYTEARETPSPSCFKVFHDKVYNEPSTTGASSHQFYRPNEKTTSNLSFDHRLDTTESSNFTEQSKPFSAYTEASQSPSPSCFKVYRDRVYNEQLTAGTSLNQFYAPYEKTMSLNCRLDTTESPNVTQQSGSFCVYTEARESLSPSCFKVFRDNVYNEPSTGTSSRQFYAPCEKTASDLSVNRRLEYATNESDEEDESESSKYGRTEDFSSRIHETESESTIGDEQESPECTQFSVFSRSPYIPFIKDEEEQKTETQEINEPESLYELKNVKTTVYEESSVDYNEVSDLTKKKVRVSKLKLFLLPRVLRSERAYKFRQDDPSLEASGPIKDGDYYRYAFKRKASYKKRQFIISGFKLTAEQQHLVYLFAQKFNWQYTPYVSNEVSHLIWEERKMNPKYYLAIANCTLLIKFEWVIKCLQFSQVLSPAPYLAPGKGVASCMIIERPQLFIQYVACLAETEKLSAVNLLQEVFTCCGGAIIDRESMFKHPDWPKPKLILYFGDSPCMTSLDDSLKRNHILPVSYLWVFESLTNYKLSSLQHHIHPSYEKYFEDDIIEKVVID